MIRRLAEQNQRLTEQLEAVTRRLDTLTPGPITQPALPSPSPPTGETSGGAGPGAPDKPAEPASPTPRGGPDGARRRRPGRRPEGRGRQAGRRPQGPDRLAPPRRRLRAEVPVRLAPPGRGEGRSPGTRSCRIRGYTQFRFGRTLDQDPAGAEPDPPRRPVDQRQRRELLDPPGPADPLRRRQRPPVPLLPAGLRATPRRAARPPPSSPSSATCTATCTSTRRRSTGSGSACRRSPTAGRTCSPARTGCRWTGPTRSTPAVSPERAGPGRVLLLDARRRSRSCSRTWSTAG